MPHRIARQVRGGWGLLGALLVLGSPQPAVAQEEDLTPEEPAPPQEVAPPEEAATLLEEPQEQEEPPMEAPVLIPMEEPPVPAAPPKQEKRKPVRQRRPVEVMGLGPALFHLKLAGAGGGGLTLLQPGIGLESRAITPWSDHFAFERVASLVFHDFQTVSNVYGWYFEEDKYRGMKLLYLWPGLLLAPLAGSNMSGGAGLVWYSHATAPSFSVDMGVQMTLFLRPSTPQFIADFGMGLYAGMGIDFSKNVGLGVRLSYTPPLFHGLASQGRSEAWTSMATLNLMPE
jgi:hypothetical protein